MIEKNVTNLPINIMKMWGITLSLLVILIFMPDCENKTVAERNFSVAAQQYQNMLERLHSAEKNPRTIRPDGHIKLVPSRDWTSGFFPGCLWLLYEYTGDEHWKQAAQKFTENVAPEQFNGTTHDIGFKMYCSFGNGLRLTGDRRYRDILLQSAETLMTRFNPKVGCIRSWDHHADVWQFPVIIDNMMNLELLFWAFRETGDSSFYCVAVSHAETTMRNHFRPDYSTWHVVNYDTVTGAVLGKHTHQGAADSSSWARGQAWGLYGFTMCYRETKDRRYLQQAQHIADFLLSHPNMPDDLVPYWDFDAPNIPDEPRDVSTAAIMCSALYELSHWLGADGERFRQVADRILKRLSSDEYRAKPGTNGGFLLMHAVGNKPANSEIDVPIIYADYYFLEANLRKLRWVE